MFANFYVPAVVRRKVNHDHLRPRNDPSGEMQRVHRSLQALAFFPSMSKAIMLVL
jgi:hypothetical protein